MVIPHIVEAKSMSKKSFPIIKPKILSAESFLAFGDVIEANDQVDNFSINDGYTQRYHDLAKVDVTNKKGRTLINIFRSRPLKKPIILKSMERHPLSSQAFMPMSSQPYLVVVAPAGEFTESAIEIFIATSKQGVNYHAGTWHHYCLALNKISDFLVIDRGGEGDNCETVELSSPLQVGLDDSNLWAPL